MRSMGPKDDGSDGGSPTAADDAASVAQLSEEAFEAPEDEGALTRFHGHHHSKVCTHCRLQTMHCRWEGQAQAGWRAGSQRRMCFSA